MKSLDLKKHKQFYLGLIVAMAALYFTMRNVSLNEVVLSVRMMDYKLIIPSFFIIILSFVFRAYRWQALLESICKVSVRQLFSPMMIGYLGNFLPARAAEVLRPYLLSKKYDITFSAAFASIVMERLFDLIMLMLIFIWVFWFKADIFSLNVKSSGIPFQTMAIKFGQICLTAIGCLIVFIYLLLNFKEKISRVVNRFTLCLPKKWREKIDFLLEEFSSGLEIIRNFRTLTKVTIYSAFVWACNIFSLYPLYFAFELQNKTIFSLLVLSVMISISVTVAPTPGFLGSYNAGVFLALHEIMNEPEAKVVSFSLIGWALGKIVVLVSGFYFTLHEHISVRSLLRTQKQ